MKKVLITGGAGFIGFHLARLLLSVSGYKVDLLDNFHRGKNDNEFSNLLRNKDVRLIERDMSTDGWFKDLDSDYDVIYHFAAIIGVLHVQNKPFDVLKNNTLMLLSVLDLCRLQKALRCLVYTSTSEVYAGTLKYFSLPLPTPETTPLAITDLNLPRTSYMLSKIYGEALCHHSKVPFIIVRPHNFYGPRMGMSHVIPELLHRTYLSPIPGQLTVFSLDHKRTFCYIDDAIRMIHSVSENEKCYGTVFNIGNQTPEISMEVLARVILKTVGKELEIVAGETSSGSPVRRCPDIEKIIRMTGTTPQISLEEGIRRTYDWYKEVVFEGKEVSAK